MATIVTGYPKWDAACNDLISQIQIASQMGGEPVDCAGAIRRGIAEHETFHDTWAVLAWKVALDNALDYDNWTAFTNATLEQLRGMSRQISK